MPGHIDSLSLPCLRMRIIEEEDDATEAGSLPSHQQHVKITWLSKESIFSLLNSTLYL